MTSRRIIAAPAMGEAFARHYSGAPIKPLTPVMPISKDRYDRGHLPFDHGGLQRRDPAPVAIAGRDAGLYDERGQHRPTVHHSLDVPG